MSDDSIRSISRAIAILQAINRAGALTLADIAQWVSLPYPTVFRIVQTLEAEGLIEREPARKLYRPTALVETLSHGYRPDSRLRAAARSHIVDLTAKLGWPITLATHVGYRMIIRDSTHALTSLTFNHYFPGYTLPILESAVGRAYLAFTEASERERILQSLRKIPGVANEHMLALFEIENLGQIIRTDGYAAMGNNRFTKNPGKTSSIAVPLLKEDKAIGAIALVFFSAAHKLSDAVDLFVPPLRDTASNIIKAFDDISFERP